MPSAPSKDWGSAATGIAIMANQPEAPSESSCEALGIEVEAMAMSDAMGVWKPDPRSSTARSSSWASPDPASVAYVGDRVDNDVLPSIEVGCARYGCVAGRGASSSACPDGTTPALIVDSLDELAERIGEAW